MAGRGARSERGNVRGALVDEFTHVIPGGTTRNCVLKQHRGADGDGRDGDMTTRGLRRSTSAAAVVGPGWCGLRLHGLLDAHDHRVGPGKRFGVGVIPASAYTVIALRTGRHGARV